jgi:DNA-directed RNA polymerase subunit RPC12/RpoP
MYACAGCAKTYEKKQFELFDKDYCSMTCLMKERDKLLKLQQQEEKRIKDSRMPTMFQGGTPCF